MKFINRVINHFFPIYHKKSYSQCGEDLIINFIFEGLKLSKITYLDIGAYHPKRLSNTYLQYKKGNHGVCVEPDPTFSELFRELRKRDTLLNIGIGFGNEQFGDFYVMTTKTLNTFSKEEALAYQSYGSYKIERVVKIPLANINTIIKENFSSTPNLISLDVEGLDYQILQSLDFDKYSPEILCVETITYTEDNSERKLAEIIQFVCSKGYFVYADTYINTIFVRDEVWRNR